MSDNLQALFEAALHVRENSYSPYSKFAVGAAVQSTDGTIYVGANIENASYPVGTCAEQSAIAAMVSDGKRKIARVMIVADSEKHVSPCGACRQRLIEFSHPDIMIYFGNLTEVKRAFSLGLLLPESFGPDNLR